jgi:hypothetical protein
MAGMTFFQKQSISDCARSNIFSYTMPSLGGKIPSKKLLIAKQTLLAGVCVGSLFGLFKADQANIKSPENLNQQFTSTIIGIGVGASATGLYASLVWLITYIFYYEQLQQIQEQTKIGVEKQSIANGGPTYDDLEMDMTEFLRIGKMIQKWTEGWTITMMIIFFLSLTISTPFTFVLGHAGYMLFMRYQILNANNSGNEKLKAISQITGKKTA